MSVHKFICWLSVVIIFAALSPLAGSGISGERASSLDELQGIFSDPPVEYRSVPFWSWNDKLTREEIDLQLEDFKDSSQTQDDADVVLSLFDPMRYKVEDPSGYDLEELRNEYGAKFFRSMRLIKNSYGEDA